MSKPRYTCRESALITAISANRAHNVAAKVFPAAVGPQITRTTGRASSLAAKAALELGPRQLHDRRAAMDVVRRQLGLTERDEQSAHLACRQLVARLDRRLAGDGRGQPLVARMRGGLPIARQRRERLAQTPLGVE